MDENVALKVKDEIEEHNGGEIFFGCLLDEEGNVKDVNPICYGNDEEVLAPYEIVKRYNAILHNHPSGNTKPSPADMNYAVYLQNEGIGFFITDNNAKKLTVVVPPIKIKDKGKIDADHITEIFSAGGLISQKKKDFEFREAQLNMSLRITDSFNKNKIAVIEAGTGIGKSLAYLIPAFLWAEANNERIAISTNTINLQNQLLNKDIPLVKKILGSQLEAVLVKGRKNYLCKLKLSSVQDDLALNDEDEELKTIVKWSATTENGDIEDLNFIPQNNIWDKVSSDADFCGGNNCIFYKECFLQKARRQTTEANILIANHHILFADIEIRSKGRGVEENILLPPYKKIVFDEAHNIDKSATSYFSYTFSQIGFYKFMSFYKGKDNKGFIPKFSFKIRKLGSDELSLLADFITKDVIGSYNYLYQESFNIFDKIKTYCMDNFIKKNDFENINQTIRIKEDLWESDSFIKNFINPLKELTDSIKNFEITFNHLITKIDLLPQKIKNSIEYDFKMAKSYKNKLESYQENIEKLLNSNIKESVIWLELAGNKENPVLKLSASPIYFNKFLNDAVYSVFDSVVLTSATLTVDNKFDYFNNLCGISLIKEKPVTIDTFLSPYDYYNKVLVAVPTDIPEPKNAFGNDKVYNEKLNNFIKKSIEATKGSSFVLFTSYHQLKKSYEETNPYLKERSLRSFYQGEMEKGRLLEKFKEDISSNLFATDSFWEGVDAPGETLRYVILTKLPFRMPTEPVEEARIEEMEKRGLNPFLDYTLPSAVIKFRQGFGRLIRKHNDYGIVALLDARVVTKSYGKIFFKSLPVCQFSSGKTDDVVNSIIKHIEKCEKK
ncbi:MAG: hypothetical protein A2Y34_07605 [Spirochaetes bacterium GWC1_27_15]|nr:MAG: hypothetical protein A2Z98_15390 [Spirochaetes bacterium GWB1_27_13]OHD27370.1 MAG: hypothetical protein A2Y34_07605 [Spirochaetes bacterium GWC1_27_15]